MKNFTKLSVAVLLAATPAQAFAVTGNVQFNGTVEHTCAINVSSAGTLTASTDYQTLASTQAGGVAGTATVTASGNGFDISVDAPTLLKPPFDTTSETLSSSYSTSGATTTSGSHSSAPNDLAHGTTNVTVNMSAVKSGSNVFEAGTYAGTVVLRCE